MAGPTKTPNPLEITFAKVKTWTTHDGGGYQGEIHTSGMPVAWMHNDGNGGMTSIEPLFVRSKALPGYAAFMQALKTTIETLPPHVASGHGMDGMVLDWSQDFYIDMLFNEWDAAHRLTKSIERAKKGGSFLYRLDTDDERTAFRHLKAKGRAISEAEGVAFLTEKYGPTGWTVL